MNFKYFIKQLRKSAIILKDENAFKKYLEDHPDYRESTIFIVDGIERKAPPKKKKTSPRNSGELKTINGVFNGAFRALEGKGYELDKLTPEQTEKFHNTLNNVLEKNKIRPLSKEEFKEMFTSEINKRFPKKEEKKEDPTKQEENSREQTLEKIYNNPRTNDYVIGNMTRKDYFNYINGSLKDSGNEELTEDEFKDYLREKVFNFTPANSIGKAEKYATDNFCQFGNICDFNNIKIEHLNFINEALNDLRIDFPRIEEDKLDVLKTNNKLATHKLARYVENISIDFYEKIEFNAKSEIFSDDYVPFPNSELKKARDKYAYNFHDKGKNAEDAIKRTTVHEVGHKLWYQRKREDSGLNRKTDVLHVPNDYYITSTTEFERKWNDLYKKFKYGRYENYETISRDISVYALKNVREFFAECFTVYRFEKEKLPNEIKTQMEEFIKWSTQMR